MKVRRSNWGRGSILLVWISLTAVRWMGSGGYELEETRLSGLLVNGGVKARYRGSGAYSTAPSSEILVDTRPVQSRPRSCLGLNTLF